MKKVLKVIGLIVLIALFFIIGKYAYFYFKIKKITTFEGCVSAGYHVTIYLNGTNPSRCTLPDGRELFDKVYGSSVNN